MTTINRELFGARINFHEELDRLLHLLAAQRLLERQMRKAAPVAPVLQRGETAEAQAVMAAQLRFKRRRTSI
jgi:hypothetical protein